MCGAEMSGRWSKHWLCVAGPCSISRRSTLATCHATDHGAPAIYNSTYVTVVEPEDRARGVKGVWELCPHRGARVQSPRWRSGDQSPQKLEC